jgi:high-affinity K+ transport system ATPase subunit B
MNDFWNNIVRYPRFFISSVAGLILVILAPFRNLLKIKKFQFIIPIVIILFITILYKILATMTGL